MTARRPVLSLLLMLLILTSTISAVDFPPLPPMVSVAAAKINPGLVSRLAALQTERADLVAKNADFAKTCGDVIAGTPADARCAEYFPILQAATTKHIERSRSFIADNKSAETAAGTAASSIGPIRALSKGVEDAIARDLTSAGPDVMTRVQRGFQCAEAGDHALATVLFKDALNHAPKNLRLRDLVDTAEGPPPSTLNLPPVKESDVRFLFPGVAPLLNPLPYAPGPDDVYYYQPGNGYFHMTRNGARVQQLLDAMSGKAPGPIIDHIK